MSSPTGSASGSPGSKSRAPFPLASSHIRAFHAYATHDLDPSTLPFLRGFGLGYAASVVPAILRILLAGRRHTKRRTPLNTFLALLKELFKGFDPRGTAVAFGIAVGGAKWGESRLEPYVRSALARVRRSQANRRRSLQAEELSVENQQLQMVTDVQVEHRDDRTVKILSTFLAGTLASFASICLLQSSAEYSPSLPSTIATPYPSITPEVDGKPLSESKSYQSPTLDITLFVLVRAVDSLVRRLDQYTGASAGRQGRAVQFVSSHGDTVVFWASCWRIMWCWFYLPERLPPSYNRWIGRLARIHPRLLDLLQAARDGSYSYGKIPSPEVAKMCAQIAAGINKPPSFVNPHHLKRLDCDAVHGTLGGPGSCQANAAKRWIQGFKDAMTIYLPVHLVPHLLFRFGGLLKAPVATMIKILLAASRSSAFLATFVASIFASVCFVRTGLPHVLPGVPQQVWDGGLATGLGCFVCGFSVLIENKHRRREMALYCAPRAIYAAMDEIVPNFLTQGRTGAFLSRWIERSIFALSTGTVVTTCVYRPDLVSGVVHGVMGKAVGDWGNPPKKLTH